MLSEEEEEEKREKKRGWEQQIRRAGRTKDKASGEKVGYQTREWAFAAGGLAGSSCCSLSKIKVKACSSITRAYDVLRLARRRQAAVTQPRTTR